MSKLIKDMNSSEAEEALINRLYTRLVDSSNNHDNRNNIGDAYRSAYLKMDNLLSRGINETSSIRWSGTSVFTAVIVVNDRIEELLAEFEEDHQGKSSINLGHIHIANCGMIEMI